jgi:hypothetical protein
MVFLPRPSAGPSRASSEPLRAATSSALAAAALLLWFTPAAAVDIYGSEAQRLRRLVGYSDIAVLATVAQIDTIGFKDAAGAPAISTRMGLIVDRQLMGPPMAAQIPVKGPDVLTEVNEDNPMKDPLGAIARMTGIRPGARGIFMLRMDPRNRCLALVVGGVFVVKGDTIVVESRWGGRRWLENVSAPLVEDGVDVGRHITVGDMVRWLDLVQEKRMLAVSQRRATVVAYGTLLENIPNCALPADVRCYRVGIEQVLLADRDSVARSDGMRQVSPLHDLGVALDHQSGVRDGEAIKIMLPPFFTDWRGTRMLLMLEPGPVGSNIWVPALDGFGMQPITGNLLARCGLPLGP